jgi:dephospho-CoA kinase
VLYTDQLAKKIISEEEEIQQKIIQKFGEKSFIDGIYNTEYISKIVFNDFKKLEELNKIIIPYVIEKMILEVESIHNNKNIIIKDKLYFIESALIFDLGIDEGFDYIISVSSSLENRIKRIKNK